MFFEQLHSSLLFFDNHNVEEAHQLSQMGKEVL